MLDLGLRRWPNIEPTLEEWTMLRESQHVNTSLGSAVFKSHSNTGSYLQTQRSGKSRG